MKKSDFYMTCIHEGQHAEVIIMITFRRSPSTFPSTFITDLIWAVFMHVYNNIDLYSSAAADDDDIIHTTILCKMLNDFVKGGI